TLSPAWKTALEICAATSTTPPVVSAFCMAAKSPRPLRGAWAMSRGLTTPPAWCLGDDTRPQHAPLRGAPVMTRAWLLGQHAPCVVAATPTPR
ncbi:hypothetical protein HN51_038468, partial [Arachis hypogaea]